MVIVIEELRKKRFQYLELAYNKSGGSSFKHLNMWELGSELGFNRDEIGTICEYLNGEGLLEHRTVGGGIAITHYGVREIEEALAHPTKPTHYFPPVNVIHIHHMEQSQIQQGTVGSTQSASFSFNAGAITSFVSELKAALPQLGLSQDASSEVDAEIKTIEAQLGSSRPKGSIVKESLASVRRILESASGGVIAQNLLHFLAGLL